MCLLALFFRAVDDAMRTAGVTVIETAVGDKHVYAAMRDGGYVLGGEQSGHIIQLGHATTGDGVLTGLKAREGDVVPVGQVIAWIVSPGEKAPA